ncbi:MAG: hypothetical protein HFI72_05615 [Peptococcaceae bacterium]|nr:hypothetical protein [Peptococcaceae bacterium]
MRKKIMLLMCMAALLVAFFSLGVVGANQVPPEVTVVAARVDNGAALELGLRIDSKNDSFQSTGVVLEYDASALKPCGWADEVTDELLNKAKVDPTALAEGETMWDHAVPLPTKGKDIISGKTAFTVIDSTTNKGYLYLSVEAPTPTNVPVQAPAPLYGLNQVQPSEMGLEGLQELAAGNGFQSNHGLIDATSAVDQVVTVRFALPTETPEPPEEPPVEPTPDPEEPDPENPTPNPDETDEPSTQADETGDGSEGGGGTGEGGGEPTEPGPTDPTDPDNPDTPENPDDPPAETAEDFMAKYGIKVAEDATAVNSPAGRSGTYFYTTDTEPVDILNWHFLSVKNGISVNSGSGGPPDPSDFAAIVFYDWDNSMLGSVIVPKGDATQYVSKFQEDKQLEYAHPGYIFGCWIPYESETPTTYGARVSSSNANNMAVDSETEPDASRQLGEPADKADFTDVQGDMVLKAAFVADEAYIAEWEAMGEPGRQYTVTPVDYGRYTTAGVNYIKVEVTRKNAEGKIIPRPAKPALRVRMISGSNTLYSLYDLSGADKEVIELLPYATTTAGIDRVIWEVVDTYGMSNWVSCGSRVGVSTSTYDKGTTQTVQFDGSNRAVLSRADKTYLYECYLGWINDCCRDNTMDQINNSQLRAVGISVTGAGNAAAIRNAILNAWSAKNSDGGERDLTKREITDALGTTAGSIFAPGE